MDTNEQILQEQLLLRGLYLPQVAQTIIERNEHVLFNNNENYETIGKALTSYYLKNSERITVNSLIVELTEQFKAIKRMKRKSEDEVRQFAEDTLHIVKTLNSKPLDNSSAFIENLNKYVRKTLTESTILRIAQKADTPDYDMTEDLLKEINKINGLDLSGQDTKEIHLTNLDEVDDVLKLYDDLFSEQYPTGIMALDEAMAGGMSKGEVAMVAATSGSGKTLTMANLAVRYAQQGCNVYYAALEEKSSRMSLRFDRLLTDASYDDVVDVQNKKVKDGFKEQIVNSLSRGKVNGIGHLTMINKLPRTMTIDDIQQRVLASASELGITYDVVFIDYPDLLRNTYKSTSESETGGLLAQDVRRVAQQLGVVMWTATQLNRTASDSKVMTMDSIEGSYRKINTVEFAMTLNQSHAEFEQGFVRYHLDKIRNRSDGYKENMLYLQYKGSALKLSDESDSDRLKHKALADKGANELRTSNQVKYGGSENNNFVRERKGVAEQFNQSVDTEQLGGSL